MTSAVAETELYDLEADIEEKNNVAADNPEVVERLMKLIESARDDLGDYNRIGKGARFYDEGARRTESARWMGGATSPSTTSARKAR